MPQTQGILCKGRQTFMEKDNKNKKDMSVDDLVKQLKIVLDIDEEEENAVSAQPGKIDAPELEVEEDTQNEKEDELTVENAETISDKVRLLDKFFEEEENKKNKKKSLFKDRAKMEKKKPAEPKKEETPVTDDVIIKKDEKKPDKKPVKKELSKEELTSFAEEIGDMFSDPETEQTAVIPPVTESRHAPGDDVKTYAKEDVKIKEEKEDILDTTVTIIDTTEEQIETDGISDTADLSPFIRDTLSADNEKDREQEDEGSTKQFAFDPIKRYRRL